MELGNMCFGNSRGEFSVPRGEGYEEEFARLFDAIGNTSEDQYHCKFENAVFRVFPYYWGDCTCGFDAKCMQWYATHRHGPACYQTELIRQTALLDGRIGYRSPETLSDLFDVGEPQAIVEGGKTIATVVAMTATKDSVERRELYSVRDREMNKLYRALCDGFGITWNDGQGSAVHCTCSYGREWDQWIDENAHDPACLLVIPNFQHKPSDYRLKWYKHPLRDSYANRAATVEELRKMVDDCVASLGRLV